MPESTLITQWGSQFLRGNFRHVRNTFFTAGQDSFSDPPMQNPDLFSQLFNVMPSVQGDLDRRWGYRAFNLSAFLGATSNYAVPFAIEQNDALMSRKLVAAVGSNISALGEDGTLYKANIFTPVGQRVQGMNSRSYLYFASGQTKSVTQVLFPGNSSKYAGTATDLGGAQAWTNPSNATGAPDAAVATAAATNSVNTNQLSLTNYGFAIPAGNSAVGYQVVVTASVSETGSLTHNIVSNLQLVSGGVAVGQPKVALFQNGAGLATVTLGSATDLWGANLTLSQINASTFGVEFKGAQDSSFGNTHNANWSVDAIQIEVFYGQLSPGVQTDLLKWDGTTNPVAVAVTNWGIDNTKVGVALVGPNNPSSASNSGTSTTLPPPDNPPGGGNNFGKGNFI